MPLIEDITKYSTLSIAGTEKNTGKTECLNYILRRLPRSLTVAVTSVGVDGELTDSVTGTPKPEITLRQGTVFATSETDYASRRIVSEVLDVGFRRSATGRIVTARALSDGRVRLSGPSSAAEIGRWQRRAERYGAGLTIIDGALSRLSSASPEVSEAMVLATGASLSATLETLVRQTAWTVRKILLPEASEAEADITVGSMTAACALKKENLKAVGKIAFSGALTDRVLSKFVMSAPCEVAVEDFTKIFCSEESYRAFCNAGGRLSLRRRNTLLAVCVNPTSPNGVRLDSEKLCREIEAATGVKTYDIMCQ